jgi:hypothetical protein
MPSQGFPTIFLVKATDKMNPVKYTGDRSVESINDFIKANRTPKKKLQTLKPSDIEAVGSAVEDFKKYFAAAGFKDEL